MATYEEQLEQYYRDLETYNAAKAEWDEKKEAYEEDLAQYYVDLEEYNQGLRDYNNCIEETTTQYNVNPQASYRIEIPVTNSVGNPQYGEPIMEGSSSGRNFSISYESAVSGIKIGTATITGYINTSYQGLSDGRVIATINSIHFNTWSNVGTGASWYAPTRPSLKIKDASGQVRWSLDSYDPAVNRTVQMNLDITVNKSFTLSRYQSSPNFTVAKIEDIWDNNNYGNIDISITNESTVTTSTVPAHTESYCRVFLKPNPTQPTFTDPEPVPPTMPTDNDIKPWAIRKSNVWKTLDRTSGFFKIRKSGSYVDKSNTATSTVYKVNEGTHRIRKSGQWRGQNRIGND